MTHDIHDTASQFNRLSPSQVDDSLSGNGQPEAGHCGHDADESRPWPLVGWFCAGGNAGNPVVEIHPDDLDTAYDTLAAMLDAAIDTGAIQDVEAAFKAAGVRHKLLF